MPLSKRQPQQRQEGGRDVFGNAYTTVTGAYGDHVRTLHDTVLADIFDELKAAGIPFRGGPGNSTKTHSRTRIAFPRTSQTVTIGTSRASSLT
jgi:hypothetical protein